MEEQENDGFVNAADFFRQAGQQAPTPSKAGEAPRRPPRESLLVVARNSQVKNKISAFDRQQATGGSGRAHGGHVSVRSGAAPRPAAAPRRAGAAPSLGAIVEEPGAAAPARRHAAVVSTATAAAPAAQQPLAQPPAVALPSPATKQQVAEKRHAAGFPSIMFHPPPQAQPPRAPLPGAVAVLPPAPAPVPKPAGEQQRSVPAILAPTRASLSPQKQRPQQVQQAPVNRQLAAVLAAEAAAAVACESEDELYEDAESGAGSGAPSRDGSAVWREDSHLVIQEDDAASVSSEASTVVHDHGEVADAADLASQPCEPETAARPAEAAASSAAPLRFSSASQKLPAPAAGLDDAPFGAVPVRRSSLSPAASAGGRRSSFGVVMAAAPEVQPVLAAPAEAAEGQPEEEETVRVSLSNGIAEVAAAQQAAAEVAAEGRQPQPLPEAHSSAFDDAAAAAPAAEGSDASSSGGLGGLAPHPEASRLSMASSSISAAPSLRIEFSEASLRYSVDHTPASQHSRGPSAAGDVDLLPIAPSAATTPKQQRLSSQSGTSPQAPANTPASPKVVRLPEAAVLVSAEDRRSVPVPPAAVAQAIALAAVASAQDGSSAGTSRRRTSLPLPARFAAEAPLVRRASCVPALDGAGLAAAAAASADAPASAAAAAPASPAVASEQQEVAVAAAAAQSPVPPTPYAATEYDGDDVVMTDADFTPGPATGRRLQVGSSRFQLEALASARRGQPSEQHPAAESTADELAAAKAVVEAPASMLSAAGTALAAAEAESSQQQTGAIAAMSGQQDSEQQEAQPAPMGRRAASAIPPSDGVEAVVEDRAAAAADFQQMQPAPAQQGACSGGLPELPEEEAAVRRSRAGRLSMPAARPELAALRDSRGSRLSLPAGMLLTGAAVPAETAQPAGQAAAPATVLLPQQQLGAEPQAQQGQGQPEEQQQLEVQQQADEEQQQQSPSQQEQEPGHEQQQPPQQQPGLAAEQVATKAATGAPVIDRQRLVAEDEELPVKLLVQAAPAGSTATALASPSAAATANAAAAEEPIAGVAAAAEEPAAGEHAMAEEQPAAAAAPELAAAVRDPEEQQVPVAEQPGEQQSRAEEQAEVQQAAGLEQPAKQHACDRSGPQEQELPDAAQAEEEQEAAAFAARPKLSMSPMLSAGAPSRFSFGSGEEVSAFAACPKLAMSPAVCCGSMGAAGPAAKAQPSAGPVADVATALPEVQQHPDCQQPEEQPSQHAEQPEQTQKEQPNEAGQAAQEQAWRRFSLNNNPLAAGGSTPAASGRPSHSPAPSRLSAGTISNNPMYAGTPGNPTPPSVNFKSFTSRLAGTPQDGREGFTPAATGMKLAEKLHQVAEQLQSPAAPQGLAAVLATPGGAQLASVAKTPGAGRFEFAEDVAAVMQMLEASTPATLGQQFGMSRVAAALATTVQRKQGGRVPRYSFAAACGPNTLLDLDSFDANGNAQPGPTPLLRQQLLATTPAAASTAAGGAQPAAAALAAAVTPNEVKALREEVAALRKQVSELNSQREEMVGLLGGYQSSIRELQDKHSVLVVHMQGENATLRAENKALRRTAEGVDSQFRTLYSEKYVPLKAEAAALRDDNTGLQKRLAAEELRAHKAASDMQALRQELAAAQEKAAAYEATAQEAQAEAAAARDAEQRLQQQLAGEQRRTEKAVAAKEAELGELRVKCGALTKQYDEAVHRINLAKQARERAQTEVQRKEEEVVALEVRVKEYEGALREYKKENAKFFEVKERYKGALAALEREVQTKEKEKHQLLEMCNELMTRLEREGLQ